MSRIGLCSLVCAFLCLWGASPTNGDNHIRQWNPDIQTSKYDIIQGSRTIIIKEGSEEIFKFEAYDNSTPPPYAPGEIWQITTDANGAGQVLLMINGDVTQGRNYGASNLWEVDLQLAACRVQRINISGDLGNPGGVDVWAIDNWITVGGNLYGGICADNGTGVHTGSITSTYAYAGTMSLSGTYQGTIQLQGGTMSGHVTVHDLAGQGGIQIPIGPLTGSVTVENDADAPITVESSISSTGSVTVQLNANSVISVGGSLGGSVTVTDQMTGTVRINC